MGLRTRWVSSTIFEAARQTDVQTHRDLEGDSSPALAAQVQVSLPAVARNDKCDWPRGFGVCPGVFQRLDRWNDLWIHLL
jgi:hypothetical protein